MFETLETGTMEDLKKQAHSVKGTSWMYGFTHLGNLCQALERSAESDDKNKTRQLIREIIQYLDTVQIRYQEKEDTDE